MYLKPLQKLKHPYSVSSKEDVAVFCMTPADEQMTCTGFREEQESRDGHFVKTHIQI